MLLSILSRSLSERCSGRSLHARQLVTDYISCKPAEYTRARELLFRHFTFLLPLQADRLITEGMETQDHRWGPAIGYVLSKLQSNLMKYLTKDVSEIITENTSQ